MVLYAALTTIPQLLDRLIVGREYDLAVQYGEVENPQIVTYVGAAISVVLVGASVLILGKLLRRVLLRPSLLALALITIVLSLLVFHGADGITLPFVAVNLVAFAALSTLRPDLSDLRVFAHVGAVIAVGSILLAVISPEIAYRSGSLGGVDTKAIIGTGILAGPYPSSNNLGMSMALALPFVFLIPGRKLRAFELAAMALALIMSASRSSIAAVLAAGLAILILKGVRAGIERRVAYQFGMVVVGLIAALTPWFVTSRGLFTNRGAIWIGSRELLIERDWLAGVGTAAYALEGSVNQASGVLAPGGHNVLLHYWVVAGLPGLVAMAVLLLAIMRAGQWSLETSLVPAGFVLTLMVLAAVEMPLRPDFIIAPAWVAAPAVAVLLAAAKQERLDRLALSPRLDWQRRSRRQV
ncbi:O-antigen ligase family protein [Nocardioides sp. AX2bis]|uniref:O-antigen ligase family protein n=1 Tax=Nocardioides sp. AX2bis TaxID=2653157 RepID=UPI0012F10281|nr:hypothetical protein [Nocardioides sp. AX2bis]VXC43752.1 conserved membrane hypothetical protein [Nocardioides sp. AX2bis]